MTRVYTDLTERVIINIRYESRMQHAHDYTAIVTTYRNIQDGFIYSVEDNHRPSKLHNNYKGPDYTVVVQYTDKIDTKKYLFEIRKLEEHKYQEWCLHIEGREWSWKDITEEAAQSEQRAMREAIETKKRQEEEYNANIENQRQKLEDEANDFIVTHPTVQSYVEQLKKDKEDLKKEVARLEKECKSQEYKHHYYVRESEELEKNNKKLNAEIDTLKDEITRLKRKILPSWINNSGPKATSDLISQLKYLNET